MKFLISRSFGTGRGRSRHSLFTRVTLAIIASTLLINVMVGFFFRELGTSASHAPVMKNLEAYLASIISEAGNPPDVDRLDEISRERSLGIIITGTRSYASSPKDLKFIERWKNSPRKKNPGFFQGRFVSLIEGPDGSLWYFTLRPSTGPVPSAEMAAILLSLLTAVLVILSLIIRWMLRPLKDLEKGVIAVSAGDFSHEVTVRGRDELASLASAYNTMRERIQTMIKMKEQLLLDISHELRSPLTRMKVALEMMEKNKLHDELRADADEMGSMIHSLLENYRLGATLKTVERTEVNLDQLMEGIIKKFPAERITYTGIPDTAKVSGDPELLSRLFTNILANAALHAPHGVVTITLMKDDGRVKVTVADQGPGISPEHLPHVFEPFYRGDASRSRETGGFGLGLAISKRIVESHNGTITLENRKEGGLLVTITLPAEKNNETSA